MWLWSSGLVLGSMPGGDGASSGVRKWCCASGAGGLRLSASQLRLAVEVGGVGWPRGSNGHGAPRAGLPGTDDSSATTGVSLCSNGIVAACKTNLVL